ncbi:hypothetical protein FMM75_21450 [Lachnospiraceae bacterium MD335]|nr:hypothetical protein [Lachnospiraceae bacterium MD335]
MADIKDIEQRAKDMIEQCQRRKAQRENKELADKIFREPERKRAKEHEKKEAAERERQELENRWSPYLEKVMRRYGTEFEGVLKE